jgi:hypothetical protein
MAAAAPESTGECLDLASLGLDIRCELHDRAMQLGWLQTLTFACM